MFKVQPWWRDTGRAPGTAKLFSSSDVPSGESVMRYRLEVLDYDNLVVHNVETGLILGAVIPHFASNPDDPDRKIISSCTVLSGAGVELAWISHTTVPSPLSVAAIAVANHENYYDYPGFNTRMAERCRPNRIEELLGT